MIVTFSKDFAAKTTNANDPRYSCALDCYVLGLIAEVGANEYERNVYGDVTWATGRRVRFTLATRDAWAHGSRTAASGRHMRKASWEAHRDVMAALFDADPDATIKTALATYRGRDDFQAKFPETAHKNVGSIMQPVTFRSTTVL